ncbi:MAG TPA: sugar nucleotide-binding protein [Candidatus Kapabacteria bacterium]|nr:sugar nucleotide-binding protein [Candidatus Kapabacteria bacterium]
MNIALIGAGQVGSLLAGALSRHSVTQWKKDIDDLSSEELARLRPDVVINAAGKTDLKWCEENAREAFRSNVEAPVQLYQRILALGKNIRFLHFSSGCVWDGPYDENGKPFTPNHPARPAAYYSWTKAACDELLLKEDPKSVAILRPRQVYSSLKSPRNILSKLLNYPKLVDTPNSMSSVDIITKTVQYLLDAKNDWTGIWNIYDAGITTPYHLGILLAEAGLREMPARITKAELDSFHKPKRVDTVLFDERFEYQLKPEPVENVLQRTIKEYAAH